MIRTQVLIVGAGPVGLVTALMLEKLGIDHELVERRATLHAAPQAHVLSSRTLEICRGIGVGDAPIRQAGPSPADTAHVRWVDRLIGRDLGVFSMGRDPSAIQRMLTHTPTPTTNLSQDQFEQHLFAHLPDPSKVRFEHTWQDVETAGDDYVSTVRNARGEDVTIHSRYLIGADGAGSAVRKAMGARMLGPDNIQTFVNIHFNANLREQLRGREGLLYWVMDEALTGTFIAHDIEQNWIFMKAVAADEPTDPIDHEKFAALLRDAIGADVDFKINSMNAWRMTSQISDLYQADRLFLIGDAAHRFPPTGGIGMNTGFQDAHNLAWKIALVEGGCAQTLLDTYGIERKPVAETNAAQSHANAMKMAEVARALDTDGDHRISMGDIDRVLADPTLSAQVQEAVDRQAAHFNMSGLDLGFCYQSHAVRSEGAPPQSDDPVSHYLPSTTPGARLPHAWLQHGDTALSTLDLVTYGRFLVLAGRQDAELEAALSHLQQAGYPIDLAVVAAESDLAPADEAFADLFGEGTLLVRPDGHIAARFTASAGEALPEVMTRLFPRA